MSQKLQRYNFNNQQDANLPQPSESNYESNNFNYSESIVGGTGGANC